MTQDRNRKEIGVGDEVVIHFRVTEVFEDSSGLVNLMSLHNRRGKPRVSETDVDFEDVPAISLSSTPTFRIILQRKAKPVVSQQL